MKTRFAVLIALVAGLASAASMNAQVLGLFNFDGVPSGTAASTFNTSAVSFHNAFFAPSVDSFGDPIVGSEHWQIDAANDSSLTVENPILYGRGNAPSPSNALQGLFQEVLISFDKSYNLASFSTTLDNDTFGSASASILFLRGNNIVGTLAANQTIAGLTVNQGPLIDVTGIVLPGGAFYDNISIVAIPEPSAWSAIIGAVTLALVVAKRRGRRG